MKEESIEITFSILLDNDVLSQKIHLILIGDTLSKMGGQLWAERAEFEKRGSKSKHMVVISGVNGK